MNVQGITFDQFWSKNIARLPQANAINIEDARSWYNSAVSDPFDDLQAHCNNLEGFSAEDAGVILANHFNVPTWFSDLPTLLEEKLLRRPAVPKRFDRIEGGAMEPVLRGWFQTATGAAPAEYSILPYPFTTSIPEDVVKIGDETVLVSYRHLPDRVPPAVDDIPFQFLAQLTHYRKQINVVVDRSIIVFSDKNSQTGFTALEVPPLLELDEAWESALSTAWAMTLSGSVPARLETKSSPTPEWENLSPAIKASIHKLEQEYVISDLLRRETYNAFRTAKAALSDIFRTSRVPMSSWVPRITTAILRQEVDDALAQEMLRVLKLDESEYRRRGAPNVEAVVEALNATHEGLKASLQKINALIMAVDRQGNPALALGQIKNMLLKISDALQALPSEPDSDSLFSRAWDPRRLSVVADRYRVPSPVAITVSPTYSANAKLGINQSSIENNREIARKSLQAISSALREILFSDVTRDVAENSVNECTETLHHILLGPDGHEDENGDDGKNSFLPVFPG